MLPKIIFNSAIRFIYDNQFDEITNFIKNNLSEKLSIKLLCEKFHINKNALYNIFQTHINMTVNEYISNKRIEKAKQLIRIGARGENIIDEIGIENYSYFCRLFKSKTGVSPSAFRNNQGFL